MLTGIIIALPTEWGYFRRAFHVHLERHLDHKRHYKGRYGRLPIAVIIAGVGKNRAHEAAERLFKEHRPSALISVGYAGALNPELKRGDIVLSSYSINQQYEPPRAVDLVFEERLRGIADESHEHHVYVGPLYTADKIVARHEEKKEIFERTGAPIVDMESLSVYRVAQSQGIPFVGIHTITDTAEEDIPALQIINPFLASDSPWRYLRLFWDIARNPRFVVDLVRLNHDARVAGRSLTHFMSSNSANLGGLISHLKMEKLSKSDLVKNGNSFPFSVNPQGIVATS